MAKKKQEPIEGDSKENPIVINTDAISKTGLPPEEYIVDSTAPADADQEALAQLYKVNMR